MLLPGKINFSSYEFRNNRPAEPRYLFLLPGRGLSTESTGSLLLTHFLGLIWAGIPGKTVQLCLGLVGTSAQFWGEILASFLGIGDPKPNWPPSVIQ